MNQPNKNNQSLSRRDALKAILAASGAVALANLPQSWQTPVVEVGHLPAHAQGTPPPRGELRIFDFSISGPQGVCDAGGGVSGELFSATFDYRDETGGRVSANQSRIRTVFEFSSGRRTTDETFLEAINITGDGEQGSIVVPLCVDFGNSDDVEVMISITNTTGDRSNTLSDDIANPNS